MVSVGLGSGPCDREESGRPEEVPVAAAAAAVAAGRARPDGMAAAWMRRKRPGQLGRAVRVRAQVGGWVP